MNRESKIIPQISKILIPLVLLFGIYIVNGGANSVGGGFQGGAILSAVFILRYLAKPSADFRITLLEYTEKILMLCFILLVFLFVGRSMNMGEKFGAIWMLLLNWIIAIKVSCGLSIIFFRYVFFEGRS